MKKILKLIGSVEDENYLEISIFYNKDFSYKEFIGYEFHDLAVFPEETFCFIENNTCREKILEIRNEKSKLLNEKEAFSKIKELNPDAIVISNYGENKDIKFRKRLEQAGFPILAPSSDVYEIGMNKAKTKRILQENSISNPKGVFLSKESLKEVLDTFNFPVVLKDPQVNNSNGVSYLETKEDLITKIENENLLSKIDADIIIEEYIIGREIRTSVLETTEGLIAFTPLEYIIKGKIRSFDDKYSINKNNEVNFSETKVSKFLDKIKEKNLINEISSLAKSAFNALGMKYYCVFDFRVSSDNKAYILEAGPFYSYGKKSILFTFGNIDGYTLKNILDFSIELLNK